MNSTENDNAPLSKTQRKHAMEALQALGEALVSLSADQVKRIDIPEDLRDAVSEARRMPPHNEAMRRQMQYIGKLMRGVDAEPIRAALAIVRGEAASETARLHRLEELRDELIADEKTLEKIVSRYPAADLQHLRSLRRAALKEKGLNKPPRGYRAIFQLLKELDGAQTSAPEDHA